MENYDEYDETQDSVDFDDLLAEVATSWDDPWEQ